jgi:hypothetical protein
MTMHRSTFIATTLIAGTGILMITAISPIARADGFSGEDSQLQPDSLVISSSTYDRSRGAVASLTVGTPLPNSATATTPAIAHNDYVNVWNNVTVDAAFGVTSPITLFDVDARDGRVFNVVRVPSVRPGGDELLLLVRARPALSAGPPRFQPGVRRLW